MDSASVKARAGRPGYTSGQAAALGVVTLAAIVVAPLVAAAVITVRILDRRRRRA